MDRASVRQRMAVGFILLALILAVVILIGPLVKEEVGHQRKYNALKAAGMDATISVEIKQISADVVSGTVTVHNIGWTSWLQGKHYFAVGVFERSWIGKRKEQQLKFDNGTNRLVIHQDIQPKQQAPWKSDFRVLLPEQNRPSTLRLQVVQEDIGWFGQEIEIVIRE